MTVGENQVKDSKEFTENIRNDNETAFYEE